MLQIGILMILALWVSKELFSIKFKKDDYSKSSNELGNEFKKKHFRMLFLFFLVFVSISILLTNVFEWFSDAIIGTDKTLIYVIKPNMGTWMVMAIFTSLGYSVFAFIKLAKLMFKERHEDYWIYYNRLYRLNASGILKYLGIIIILVSSILVCLNLDTYLKIKENQIEINGFRTLKSQQYDLESITKIVHYKKTVAPNGNIVKKPHYALFFEDGFEWRTNDDLREPNKGDDKIFDFLSQQTNLNIEEIELDN